MTVGLLLILISSLALEVSSSIGKAQVKKRHETLAVMGFLGVFWSCIWFGIIGLAGAEFSFSVASVPTFGLRLGLEILLMHITLKALVTADRSTYSFLHLVTVPVLLIVDLVLGYEIKAGQIAGIVLLVFTLSWLFHHPGISRKGTGLIVASSLLAVVTTSLFKYDITHYNSVLAEQSIVLVTLLGFFWWQAKRHRTNPWSYLLRPLPQAQSFVGGLGVMLLSYAFLFAPASVVMAARRTLAVLWSVLAGNIYFRERHFHLKLGAVGLVGIGLMLVAR